MMIPAYREAFYCVFNTIRKQGKEKVSGSVMQMILVNAL